MTRGHSTTTDGADDGPNVSRSAAPTIGDLIELRLTRRAALQGLSSLALLTTLGPVACGGQEDEKGVEAGSKPLTFVEVSHGLSETHAVAEGYRADVLIRWGDPMLPGAPPFDPLRQTADTQSRQWGYNNDFVAYLPLPAGTESADRGLLCVNFEFTHAHMMFPGLRPDHPDEVSREQVDVELAAHGHGIIEIRRDPSNGRWSFVADSPYNRRITALATPCRISGPAAGHERLQTRDDPTGTRVIGTLNNCAGGKTPWGTLLIAEENFNIYFSGDVERSPEARNHQQYGIRQKSSYAWSRYHDRFSIESEPNEPNRFGWMVEVDPYDPLSVPVKRTALGRFKHEGATCVVNKDGRLVVYSGDDERFEYIYRFVSKGRFTPGDDSVNRGLLDDGTLFVARFDADGSLIWLPLTFGAGPLTAENGFASQADVLIETRRAADLMGATPMDRPEDIEPNLLTGIVYVNLTNNSKRARDQVDAANPRGPNPHGHIIALSPPGGAGRDRDHAHERFTWDVFLLAGDPKNPADGALYHPQTSDAGWLSSPDNMAFDRQGRIWIATDGAPNAGFADGVWAAATRGAEAARTRHFYRAPLDAEVCGPEFNPDDTAFFVAIQHPGDDEGRSFDAPSTRWPDFKDGMPPRPSVQVIVRNDGGAIGS